MLLLFKAIFANLGLSMCTAQCSWKTCCGIFLLLLPFVGRIAAAEETRYRVVPEESVLEIFVFRAGALGRLGHNHVVTSRGLTGSVVVGEAPADSSVELSLPVRSLTVDDPEARVEAGAAFESDVSEEDREGTRKNMMGGRLLDAETYERVVIESQRIEGDDFSNVTISAEIDIKGEKHDVELPVSAVMYGDRLVATGMTDITHSELGLTPFRAGFGTLRVAEEMTFRYRIVAVEEPQRVQ